MKLFLASLILFLSHIVSAQMQAPRATIGHFFATKQIFPSVAIDIWALDLRYSEQRTQYEQLRAQNYLCERKTEVQYLCRKQKKLDRLPTDVEARITAQIDLRENVHFFPGPNQYGQLIYQSQDYLVWGFANQVVWNGLQLPGYQIQQTSNMSKLSLYTAEQKFVDGFLLTQSLNTLLKTRMARFQAGSNRWHEYQVFNVWLRR